VRQLPLPAVEVRLHQGQIYEAGAFTASSLCLVMMIHRLNPEPPGAGHADQIQTNAAKKPGGEFLRLHAHADAGSLVQKGARLEHNALAVGKSWLLSDYHCRARRCVNDKLRSTSRASRSCGAPFAGIIGLQCHSYRPHLHF
jgi:hypothetical protein